MQAQAFAVVIRHRLLGLHQQGGRLRHALVGAQGLGHRHHQGDAFVGHLEGGAVLPGTLDQLAAQGRFAGAQRGQRQGLEVGVGSAAPTFVGRQLQQAVHVGHGLLRAIEAGQADHAVDQQHAHQALVAQLSAAREAFLDVAHGLVVVAELDQLVRQVAVQHHLEAVAACGPRLVQRLVHVGEGLLRLAERRVAAGDHVQQHAQLITPEHAQPFGAQGQHALQRFAVLGLAPQAAGDAHLGQQVAGAVVGDGEAALRGRQFARGLLRRGVPDEMQPAHQACPALGGGIAFFQRTRQRLVGQHDAALGVAVEQLPGAARQAQGGRLAWWGGLRLHRPDSHSFLLRAPRSIFLAD